MKIVNRVLLAGVLLVGVAACGDTDEDPDRAGGAPPGSVPASAPATQSPPSAAPTSSSGTAPSCVTGRWRATGVASAGSVGEARGRIAGGTGTVMTVGPDGRAEVDFTAGEPLTFTAEAAGADIRGEVRYQGSFRGALAFDPVDRDGAGRWIPQRGISWSDLRATVRLSEPFAVTLLDGASLADLGGDTLPGTNGAIDVQPILRGGTYRCAGTTLRVETRNNGPTVVWTFARA
jgi:hypothetical protein